MTRKLSPPIQFGKFSEDWEQHKCGDVLSESREVGHSGDIAKKLTVKLWGKGVYAKDDKGSIATQYYVRHAGQFIYSKLDFLNSAFGVIPKELDFFESTADLPAFDCNGVNPYFMYYRAIQPSFYVKNGIVADGTRKAKRIHVDTFLSMPLVLPSSTEQDTIVGFLQEFDNCIILHQCKCDRLVAAKASMLDKLFVQEAEITPKIRFGEYTKPWRKVRLGEIVVPYSNPVETPHDGYERLGIRSHGKGVFHDYVEAGNELGTAQMHRVAAHNLIVNITFAWEHAVAITCDDDDGKLVSHRFPQFSMTDDIYDQFLKYLILDTKFRHHLLLSSPGGAGRNRVLKVPEMFEYEMMIPEIEEQKEIAGYLNSLDELIELYKVRVEMLKNIKTAFLQKMFV
ncbi:restriction endonuclease subunit S [Lachnospiraceae bacterium NSJ-143]|nr:restriction endonuclease subunit S [Lachnospiraceae bacterium NSJ-143]